MLAYIVLLWIIVQLKAPLWCYILVVGAMLIRMLEMILQVISRVIDKKIEEMGNDLDTM